MTKPARTSSEREAPGADTPASTVQRLAAVRTLPTSAEPDPTDSLRDLYERCHADMVRFAAFLTGDVHAAEDVVHEAFIRLVDAWERIDDPDRAEAYLRTIVLNVVRGGHRRRQVAERRRERHLAAVDSAEDDALGLLSRERVLAAVAALPLRQRACVVMRYWMRMTESEIAETLGVSIGSVRTHAKRGTAALQQQLGDAR